MAEILILYYMLSEYLQICYYACWLLADQSHSYVYYTHVYIVLSLIMYRWETLWSGLPQQKEAPESYRKFSLTLKKIDYSTKLVIVIQSDNKIFAT